MNGFWVLILVLLAGCASTQAQRGEPVPNWSVCFTPKGGCTEAVVKELGRARRLVVVQAYSLTSAPIAKALVDAHRYGVKVEIILDKSQKTDRLSSADSLARAGIPTKMDNAHAAARNEVIIIDAETVITGSFLFTQAAEEQNAANLLIIRNRAVAGAYIKNYLEHSRHSEPYTAKPKTDLLF
jgi:phosphatidylserine/phosphatidylglycerophosphate/cardiolipin synthase-like enzyme